MLIDETFRDFKEFIEWQGTEFRGRQMTIFRRPSRRHGQETSDQRRLSGHQSLKRPHDLRSRDPFLVDLHDDRYDLIRDDYQFDGR